MDKDLTKKEIEITLLTNLPEEYKIINNRLSIPLNFDTEKLRKLLKKMLNIKEKLNENKQFIFFIENKLLDNTINSFLSTYSTEIDIKKISEIGLEIFYSFELEEPKLINTIKEDEWIKKISIMNVNNKSNFEPECYCVGLFNSEITIYNNHFEKVLKLDDSNATQNKQDNYCELLHDLIFFKSSSQSNIIIKASRNEDYNLKIYSVDLNKMNSSLLYVESKTGTEYVNSVDLNPKDYAYFSTGDTDGCIKVFNVGDYSKVEIVDKKKVGNKKRRIEAQDIKAELIIENCHSEIKILKWINNQQILTTGDDFTIKLWNINTKSNYSVFNTNYRYPTSLCLLHNDNDKFLTGFDDGSIRLWDSRVTNTKFVFTHAHSNYVSDIICNPDSSLGNNNFASVGYDGYARLWDLRSTKKALYEIKTDSEKNYTISYNSSKFLMTGGDNSSVNIYQS